MFSWIIPLPPTLVAYLTFDNKKKKKGLSSIGESKPSFNTYTSWQTISTIVCLTDFKYNLMSWQTSLFSPFFSIWSFMLMFLHAPGCLRENTLFFFPKLSESQVNVQRCKGLGTFPRGGWMLSWNCHIYFHTSDNTLFALSFKLLPAQLYT